MTNFKEHDGLIFKMLEEPVPLTADAELPCLIRPIQDDSPMGRYVQQCWGHDKLFMREYTICSINADMAAKVGVARDTPLSIHMFEIIGTPVKEGSAEWALYQMIQGEKVTKGHLKHTYWHYDTRPHLQCISEYICGTLQIMVSPEIWIKTADSTGWQLCEPKPEPIFTTGDKVTDGVIEGTIIHIEDAIADVCPSTDEYKIELRNLNHIPESPKQDDVEKPLRSMIAEAKAIGKNIRTYYQDIVFTPQALEACLNQGKFRWWNICNWEITTREQNYFPSISTSSDGQIYDEIEPLYKVGDWVEWCGDQYMVESAPPQSGGRYNIRSPYDELGCSVYPENITRKLDPSEVVIPVNISGTVRQAYNEDGTINYEQFQLLPNGSWDGTEMFISFDALDTQTRELVESLLEAQEEE